jgi:phosphoglycolate phosphatase-like HAD superfamily hydrolase
MTRICAGTHQFDINCAVLDKDGTLIDFEQAWGKRIRDWIALIVSTVGGDEALANALYHMFGYDAIRHQVAIDGPILVASGSTMKTLSAGVLYAELGLPWHQAEKVAIDSLWTVFGPPLSDEEIQPLGDIRGKIREMRAAGIAIAVATADHRQITEHCLQVLGIDQDVDLVMCGDDPLPQKPDPGVFAWITSELDLEPGKLLMIGDTINDLLTGLNGNAAGCIGISPNGSNGAEVLAPFADVVLATIDEIRVECS